MKRWHYLTSLLLAGLSLLVAPVVFSQGNDAQRPRNLRIVRVDAGGSKDRLVARWDPPSSGSVGTYYYRTRTRPSGASGWGSWSEYRTTSSRSVTLTNLSKVRKNIVRDFQIQVDAGDPDARATATASDVSGSKPIKEPLQTPVPMPPTFTCESLSNADSGIKISSTSDLGTNTQCQRIGAAGIGVASVIEGGIVDAVDVWGTVQRVQICFSHQQGSFLFLDAATSPRTLSQLEAYLSMGMICTDIDRPGSVVLVPSAEPVAEMTSTEVVLPEVTQVAGIQVEEPQAEVAAIEGRTLHGCWIWTNYVLRLRSAPVDGAILTLVPYDVALSPTRYHDGWFQVEWFGSSGWVAGDLVRTAGNCS